MKDIGFSVWGAAPQSWLACPCCGAKARVRHIEPPSGGGKFRHEHRCRRCRHEWRAEPADWRKCPVDHCDGHGLDATRLGCLLEDTERDISDGAAAV